MGAIDTGAFRQVMRNITRIERTQKTLELMVKLIIGLYVWAVLLSMEVFDVVDIDIEPGENLPALGWESLLAHGQNIVAMLVLIGGIVAAFRHILDAWRNGDDPRDLLTED